MTGYMKILVLLPLVIIFILAGCSREDKYAKLTYEERYELLQQAKVSAVRTKLCGELSTEIFDYKTAKSERRFTSRDSLYFNEYENHYKVMLSPAFYPMYKILIKGLVGESKFEGYDGSFSDVPMPKIGELECKEKVKEWLASKEEWAILKKELPDDFFGENANTFFDWVKIYFNFAVEKLFVVVGYLFGSVFVGWLTFRSINANYLIVKGDWQVGLLTIVFTPLACFTWSQLFRQWGILSGGRFDSWINVMFVYTVISFVILIIIRYFFPEEKG
jgi:hypothetical protein